MTQLMYGAAGTVPGALWTLGPWGQSAGPQRIQRGYSQVPKLLPNNNVLRHQPIPGQCAGHSHAGGLGVTWQVGEEGDEKEEAASSSGK